MVLKGKNIVIGVTGGIACYKACDLVGGLIKLGANVDVIMTKNAMEFVSPLTFETLSNNPVVTDTFARARSWEVEHISLAKKADLMLIAPATANFIAKSVQGIADDMLTTTYLACAKMKMICPAMNTAMLNAEITRQNITVLKDRGVLFVAPTSGRLACGDIGDGKLASVDDIIQSVCDALCRAQDLKGKTVVVTAGGTEESIDKVRVITNHSSGKMGVALAKEAMERGARVILVKARTTVEMPCGVEIVDVTTTDDMYKVVVGYSKADYLIMAAAPSDYKVNNRVDGKIKSEKLTLDLIKNVDIAKEYGKIKTGKMVIFSAETDNLIQNATDKLFKKNADMVVANDVTKVGAGFNTDTNIISIITNNGNCIDYDIMTKSEVAKVIIDNMIEL